MLTEVNVDTRELELLAAKFESLGGSFKDNPNIKRAFKQAAGYLITKGKSNLRGRVKDQSNWQIMSWFATKIGRKGTYSLAGFKIPPFNGEHHGLPWWLDQGTKDRHTKSGHHTGSATPNFFWEDVKVRDFEEAAGYVVAALKAEINKIDI